MINYSCRQRLICTENVRQRIQAPPQRLLRQLAFLPWHSRLSKMEKILYAFFDTFHHFSPSLTWRDIQHLTVLTSKRNSLYDAKNRFHWTMNGVGLEFNHLFGFGVLDAGGMVTLSKQWRTVPPRYHCEAGSISKIK